MLITRDTGVVKRGWDSHILRLYHLFDQSNLADLLPKASHRLDRYLLQGLDIFDDIMTIKHRDNHYHRGKPFMITLLWLGFIAFILILLALDLSLFNRKTHTISVKEALYWTALWIITALMFGVAVYYIYEFNFLDIGLNQAERIFGKDAALQFITGYIIEKSLSIDNIFVIAIIFSHFNIPPHLQHRVLFWGILGAIFFRGILIAMGSLLLSTFSWIVYVFGALLLFTSIKLFLSRNKTMHFDENIIIKLVSKAIPISQGLDDGKFLTREHGRLAATPMLVALLVIESADMIFAIDSVPAIFAITKDPFIVFSSNIFAVLGLRSLYFALVYMLEKFAYLKASLVLVLAFVGIKIMISAYVKIPTLVSLAIILVIIGLGVVASIFAHRRGNKFDK